MLTIKDRYGNKSPDWAKISLLILTVIWVILLGAIGLSSWAGLAGLTGVLLVIALLYSIVWVGAGFMLAIHIQYR
jgi:hypothetical protein